MRNDNRNDRMMADRDALIRERMRADGIGEEEARRLVLKEEELRVGKSRSEAGAVELEKRVETEHVRRDVPLRREEAVIERRPVTDGMVAGDARIGDNEEIRVPLHAEEAMVEKRVVPKEELVVKKREVVENQTVEADLRRERAEVHSEGQVDLDRKRTDKRR